MNNLGGFLRSDLSQRKNLNPERDHVKKRDVLLTNPGLIQQAQEEQLRVLKGLSQKINAATREIKPNRDEQKVETRKLSMFEKLFGRKPKQKLSAKELMKEAKLQVAIAEEIAAKEKTSGQKMTPAQIRAVEEGLQTKSQGDGFFSKVKGLFAGKGESKSGGSSRDGEGAGQEGGGDDGGDGNGDGKRVLWKPNQNSKWPARLVMTGLGVVALGGLGKLLHNNWDVLSGKSNTSFPTPSASAKSTPSSIPTTPFSAETPKSETADAGAPDAEIPTDGGVDDAGITDAGSDAEIVADAVDAGAPDASDIESTGSVGEGQDASKAISGSNSAEEVIGVEDPKDIPGVEVKDVLPAAEILLRKRQAGIVNRENEGVDLFDGTKGGDELRRRLYGPLLGDDEGLEIANSGDSTVTEHATNDGFNTDAGRTFAEAIKAGSTTIVVPYGSNPELPGLREPDAFLTDAFGFNENGYPSHYDMTSGEIDIAFKGAENIEAGLRTTSNAAATFINATRERIAAGLESLEQAANTTNTEEQKEAEKSQTMSPKEKAVREAAKGAAEAFGRGDLMPDPEGQVAEVKAEGGGVQEGSSGQTPETPDKALTFAEQNFQNGLEQAQNKVLKFVEAKQKKMLADIHGILFEVKVRNTKIAKYGFNIKTQDGMIALLTSFSDKLVKGESLTAEEITQLESNKIAFEGFKSEYEKALGQLANQNRMKAYELLKTETNTLKRQELTKIAYGKRTGDQILQDADFLR